MIRICSWNLKNAGNASGIVPREKLKVITRVFQNFDICCLQEVRTELAMQNICIKMNQGSDDKKWLWSCGKEVGNRNKHRKEVTGFIWDSKKITLLYSVYTVLDEQAKFNYPPCIAHFVYKETSFRFSIINVHIQPSRADEIVIHLPQVLRKLKRSLTWKDIVVLGDFNYDLSDLKCKHILNYLSQEKFMLANSNKYDHILVKVTKLGTQAPANKKMAMCSELLHQIKQASDHEPLAVTISVNHPHNKSVFGRLASYIRANNKIAV